MALQLRSSRVNFISKLTGVFIAVFALFIQPVVALDLPAAFAAPVINEIMPNPVGISDAKGEWVELKNEDSVAVDISNWTIAGATVPDDTSIAANGFFVLCKTAEATTECDAVSSAAMSLVNDNERTITLKDASGNPVDEFTYNKPTDSGLETGQSVEVVKESGEKKAVNNSTDNYATNQSPSNSDNTGTPGTENRAQAAGGVRNKTSGETYTTIQAAIDDAQTTAGNVIEVSDGTYEAFVVHAKSAVNLTIKAADGANPVIEVASTGSEQIAALRGVGTTLEDFRIRSTVDGANVGVSISGSGSTVRGNVIENTLTGIQTAKTSTAINNTIVGNTIESTSAKSYGLSVQSTGNTLKNNDVNVTYRGLSSIASNNTIELNNFNIVDDTSGGSQAKAGPGVDLVIEDNWWGADTGIDSAIENGGTINANPWLCQPFGEGGNRASVNGSCAKADTQNPRITNKNPSDNGVIGGSYKISATVTDDVELNVNSVYANFNLASGEKRYTLNKEVGTDTYSATINTKAIQPKGVSEPFSISFRAEDAAGNNRSSKSQNVIIDNQGPSISAKTPTENEHINGMYKVSAIVKDMNTTVDDKSVYARFRDDAGKEYTHYLTREVGTDIFSKKVNTIDIGGGNTGPNRVSFFARDSFGTSRSSVSDGVVIDNAAPRVSNIEFSREIDGNISGIVDITFDLTDASKIDFGQTKLLFADGPSDRFHNRESSKYTPISTGGNSYRVTVNTRDFVKQGHDGKYNLQFNLRDELGNNTSTKPLALLVDNAGPSIASKTPAEGRTIHGKKFVASAIVTDPSGVKPESVYVRFRDDSGKEYTTYLQKQNEQGLYSADIDTTKIGDGNTGPNRVSFFARDGFGTSRSSVSDGVRIDNAAPVVSNVNIVGQDDKTKNISGVVTVTFDMADVSGIDESRTRVIFGNEQATDRNHAYEAVKNPTCTENGAVYNCEATFNTKSFVSANHTGVYTLGINPYDKLGNQTSMKPAEYRNLLVDNSGPGFTLISPASGSLQNGEVQLVFKANDDTGVSGGYARLVSSAGKTVQERDIQPTSDDMVWIADFDTAGLTDGEYTIDVRPIDTFGTARYNKNIGSIAVNRVAPDSPAVVFTADNDGDTVTNNGMTDSEFFTFNLDSTANDIDHYELKYWNNIEGSSFKENAPWPKNNIPSTGEYKDRFQEGEGTHYFSFIACDEANNCSKNPTVFEVEYDSTAPVAPSVTGSTSDPKPTLIGVAEPSSNIVVGVNGNEYRTQADEEGNWTVEITEELADGDYSVVVYSTDAAGNRSSDTNYSLTVGESEPAPENMPTNTSTPSPISPLSQLAFNQGITGANGSAATGSVLGAATTGNESDDDDNGDVLGTNSPSTDGSVKNAAVAQSPEGWKLFGIAWYWILLLLAALAGLWWFLVARRNAAEDANL